MRRKRIDPALKNMPEGVANEHGDASGRGASLLAFGIVGALGFFVDAGVLYAAAPLAGWYAARGLSFLAAATFTWWLNRKFTFAAQRKDPAHVAKSLGREYLQYLLSMVLGGLVNFAAYSWIVANWHGRWVPLAGVALGSILGLFVNFTLARYFVFKTTKRT